MDLKRRGAALGYLDVGGGLGIDYDGTKSDTQSSMNYSVQEYANDVVSHVQTVCDEAGVPHPQLLSESGRAVAAQHSVLVVETLGVTTQGDPATDDVALHIGVPLDESYEQPVHDLKTAHDSLSVDNAVESFHDAQVALDLCMNLFSGGYLPLEQRVAAENLYFSLCRRIRDFSGTVEFPTKELKSLESMLSDIYFVNFSLFQSMPDAWAIGQLFPIMPIHRLDERPTRNAVLGDITCDSDGKVESFICQSGHKKTLRLHSLRQDEPYQLAVFLVGAYQEILGDLHNLFGDTHAVHVDIDGGQMKIGTVVKGDTLSEVLSYVQYDDRELIESLRGQVEDGLAAGHLSSLQVGETMTAYENALKGYTYLNPPGTGGQAKLDPAELRALRIPQLDPA